MPGISRARLLHQQLNAVARFLFGYGLFFPILHTWYVFEIS